MLTGAFIFFIIAIASGYIGFKSPDPKLIYRAKIACFISLIIFLALLFTYFYYPTPVPKEIINPLM